MASYLVTGGAGFIGSHLSEELRAPRPHGPRRRQPDHRQAAQPRRTSAGSRSSCEGRSRRPGVRARARSHGVDYVLHQAAIPSVPRSVEDPITSNRANIDASLNVLVAARDAGVKRLVYAGSSSAYGNTPTLPKREDMPTEPAVALRAAEAGRRAVLPDVHPALRVGDRRRSATSTCSGRGRIPGSPYSGVISLFSTRAPRGRGSRPSTATASRRATSPTSPTSSTACCARARRPSAAGEVINVATGGRISLNELLRRVKRHRRHAAIEPIYGPTRAGDVRDSQADITKAERLLGYRPHVAFEEGLRRTLARLEASEPSTPKIRGCRPRDRRGGARRRPRRVCAAARLLAGWGTR